MSDVSALYEEGLDVDDALDFTSQPLQDGETQQEETQEETEEAPEQEAGDIDAPDTDDAGEGEEDAAPEVEPAPQAVTAEEFKSYQENSENALRSVAGAFQKVQQELAELKQSQAKPEETKPALPEGLSEQQSSLLRKAFDHFSQQEYGMAPSELKATIESLRSSQEMIVGQANEQRSNTHLQERIASLKEDLDAEELQGLSEEAKTFYHDGSKPVASMDPTKPWNIPPDVALYAAQGQRAAKAKRQTATDEVSARKAKEAKSEGADSASVKRTPTSSKTVLPDNVDEMSGDELLRYVQSIG